MDRFAPPLPWHGKVQPLPPGRRAWVKFSGITFDGEVSVETDDFGQFTVQLENEGLFFVVVVWDDRVQYTGTIKAEYVRNFLNLNVRQQANRRSGKSK